MRFKRIVTLFVVCAALLQLFSGNVCAAVDNEEKYQVVRALTGIRLDDDDAVTRKQFALLLSRAMNEELPTDSGVYFSDVPPATAESAAIGYLMQYGIVSGDGNGYFYPDNVITRSEAAKMLVASLGRTLVAEVRGGYYAGYLSEAEKIGLMKGCSGAEELCGKDAMLMVYNTIHTNMLTETGISVSGGISYDTNETFLHHYRDIYIFDGTVNATRYIGINGCAPTYTERIAVGGAVYEQIGVNFDKYLGYNVRLYYKDGDSGDIAVYMYPKDNSSTIVDAWDISVNPDVHSLTLLRGAANRKYWKISQYADFIYNGRLYEGIKPSDFVFDDGYVELIDNDKDDKADVVIINSVKYTRVSAVDEVGQKIYGTGSEIYDLLNNQYSELINEAGFDMSIEEVQTDDILEVYESLDEEEKLLKIICVSNSFSGKVDSVSESDAGNMIVSSAEEEYRTTRAFANSSDSSVLKIGKSFIFYLNQKGEIASVKPSSDSGMLYGYLLKARVYSDEDAEDKVVLRIYTQENKYCSYNLAEKVKTGDSSSKMKAIVVYESLVTDNGTQQQMLKFSVNDDGEINSIYTAKIMPEYDGKTEFYATTNAEYTYYSSPGCLYNTASGSNYYAGNPTAYFNIVREPNRRGVINTTDNLTEEEIYVSYAPHMIDGSKQYATIYDFGYANNASCVLVEPKIVNALYDNNAVLVNKVKRGIDDDNEALTQIFGWKKAQKVIYEPSRVFKSSSQTMIDNMKRGDIYIATFDKQQFGLIESAVKVYSADAEWSEGVTALVGSADVCSKQAVVKGTVYDCELPALCIDVNGVKKNVTIGSITNFYIYDEDTGEYVITDGGEIHGTVHSGTGSRVVVYARYSLAYDVIILN